MKLLQRLTELSIDHPRTVLVATFAITVAAVSAFPSIKIDTDPENMLEADEPDRVFYNETKAKFRIYDGVAFGIFDPVDILRPESLEALDRATRKLLEIDGVVARDVTSLTTSYNMFRLDDGTLTMPPVNMSFAAGVSTGNLPKTAAEVEELRRHIRNNWIFPELLLTEDNKGTVIVLPLTRVSVRQEKPG
jgi:hypothetical protein